MGNVSIAERLAVIRASHRLPEETILQFSQYLESAPDEALFRMNPLVYAEAVWLQELFDGLGLACFPKASGSKGLQLYVPLNTPITYEEGAKPFAREVARLLEREHPELVVHKMLKALRV